MTTAKTIKKIYHPTHYNYKWDDAEKIGMPTNTIKMKRYRED